MSLKTKPLLSDELANELDLSFQDARTFFHGLERYREHLRKWRSLALEQEADRSKLMAVLQVCADALNKSQDVILRMADGPNRAAWGPQLDTNDDALSQLKAIGIEPNHHTHPAGDN